MLSSSVKSLNFTHLVMDLQYLGCYALGWPLASVPGPPGLPQPLPPVLGQSAVDQAELPEEGALRTGEMGRRTEAGTWPSALARLGQAE